MGQHSSANMRLCCRSADADDNSSGYCSAGYPGSSSAQSSPARSVRAGSGGSKYDPRANNNFKVSRRLHGQQVACACPTPIGRWPVHAQQWLRMADPPS